MTKVFDYFTRNPIRLLLIFTIAYVAAFTVNGLLHNNLEFLYYTALMIGLIYLTLYLNRFLQHGLTIMSSLSVLGFMHLAGGNLYIKGIRLYDYYLLHATLPWVDPPMAIWLRYDNLVHTLATFIVTVMLYNLLANYIATPLRDRYSVFAGLLVLMALGLGTVNELVEFIAVVFLGAEEQVGGYFNNSLDIVFNTIGAILGTVLIYIYSERPRFIQKLNEKLDRTR